MNPGIYFLLHRKKIVYIGRTINLKSRLNWHRYEGVKKFDSVRFLPCDQSKLSHYEKRWVARFNPMYNKTPGGELTRRLVDEAEKTVLVGFYTKRVNVERVGGMQAAREKAKEFIEAVPA